jgi:phage baseplate assembly protein W
VPDISHAFGGDLALGPTGDLELASPPSLTQQRVLRRLLTNAGDYIWQLDYGAGLPQFVGKPANVLQISAVIRGQIFSEAAVAASPEPTIDVSATAGGLVSVQLRYTDATTTQTQLLSFNLDA